MDVSVIRTKDGYYNVTKVVQDCGYSDFHQISKFKWWKDYYELVKQYGKYDPETNEVTPNFDLLHKSSTDKSPPNLENIIPDELLMIEIKTRSSEIKWIAGTYIHEILINRVLSHINNEYAFKISHLINIINKELHLKNMTLEEKVLELTTELENLKDLYEKSNRGKNHDKPGCITCKPSRNLPNTYKIWYSEIPKVFHAPNEHIIYDVYNARDVMNILNTNSKNNVYDDVSYISANVLNFESMEVIENHIQDIQLFKSQPVNINIIISNLKKTYGCQCDQLKYKLFEVYCSIKYEIPVYLYCPCEKIGLSKQDKGLDLLDTNTERLGQCKYWTSSSILMQKHLDSFFNFCLAYPEYDHLLFISSKTKYDKGIEKIVDVDIVVIDDYEFSKWYDEQTLSMGSFCKTKNRVLLDDESYVKAQDWLKNELDDKPFIFIEDAIEYIQNHFNIHFANASMFGQLFSHIYIKNTKHCVYQDKHNGRSFIVSPLKLPPVVFNGDVVKTGDKTTAKIRNSDRNIELEKQFIIDTVDCGQVLFSEFLKLFEDHFHYSINLCILFKDFGNIIMKSYRKTESEARGIDMYKLIKRSVHSHSYPVVELEDQYKPNFIYRLQEFASKIDIIDITTLTMFNNQFHRYDSVLSMKTLFDKLHISINELITEERKQILIEKMKCGQYTKKEIKTMYKELFGEDIDGMSFLRKYQSILKIVNRSNDRLNTYQRIIDGKKIDVYELKTEFMPRNDLNEFINIMDSNKGSVKKISAYLNQRFHRYDTNKGFIELYKYAQSVL